MLLNMVGGAYAPDGNDIAYPVALPSQDNKLYKEADISAIATAIDNGEMTVSSMAGAIRQFHNSGRVPTKVIVQTATYTFSDL